MSGVPYTFASATSSIPLSQLDANFATNATLGNASVGLGNTTTTVGNLTVSNVTINGLSGGGSNGVVYINSSNVATANASVFALDGNGNLGLGVTPSAWGSSYKALAISTESNFYASINQNGITLNAYNDNTNWKYTTNDYATKYTQYAGAHYWSVASSGTAGNTITFNNPMTLDNSGNLLVGTTTNLGTGITVVSSSNPLTARVTSSNQSAAQIINGAVNTGTSCSLVAFQVGTSGAGAQVGTISYDGTFTKYNSTSDVRLKKNIVDAGSGLAKLANVKIRSFDWVDHDNHTDFGVVAQEIDLVAPEVVTHGVNNEDGTMKTPWGVDTSVLVPAMIKAIQELSAQVTTLQSQVAALQAKVGA